jgi:UDP-glucose 4,6-dehydratase
MKISILGKNSFIASHLNYEIIPERLLADQKQILSILEAYKPDVVINCMGYCGVKNIDDCETNKERTLESNLTIPTILATECAKLNIKMIHIGSGCIYYGESPNLKVSLAGPRDNGWKENSDPKLGNASFYSKVKYACDLAIGSLPNVCALRIRMPISYKNAPRNLINKLLKYENILETENSVTFIKDLVNVIGWVIENNKTGIYHVTNPTPLTHIQILEEYRKYYPEHKYNKINEEQLQEFITAPRSNCFLNTDKLTSEGFTMTPSLQALEECMASYVQGTK